MQPSDLIPAAHQQPAVNPVEETLPDVILVNPGGRLVEVTGENAQGLLAQGGFRIATDQEAAPYRKHIADHHPEVLRQLELKRVREAKAAAAIYISQNDTAQPITVRVEDEEPADEPDVIVEEPSKPAENVQTDEAEDESKPKPRGSK